jgi:hypothetical protein
MQGAKDVKRMEVRPPNVSKLKLTNTRMDNFLEDKLFQITIIAVTYTNTRF